MNGQLVTEMLERRSNDTTPTSPMVLPVETQEYQAPQGNQFIARYSWNTANAQYEAASSSTLRMAFY